MRPLANAGFDPRLPLQTKQGTKEALRCSLSKVNDHVAAGDLVVVDMDGNVRITTDSIFALIERNIRRRLDQPGQTEAA